MMGGLETLGVALAGGSIGAILARSLGVPVQVRDHNRQAAEYDEDLGQWVSDECVRLERALLRHENESAATGQRTSGSYVTGIAHVKETFLQAYRDQERSAERKLAALQDSEGWGHRAWRWVMRKGQLPELKTGEKAAAILDGWRAEVSVKGVGTAPVSDPTRRSLAWAVDKYGGTEPGNE